MNQKVNSVSAARRGRRACLEVFGAQPAHRLLLVLVLASMLGSAPANGFATETSAPTGSPDAKSPDAKSPDAKSPARSAADAGTRRIQTPNVILIMADDMGYECLGCNGSTYATPHLDRLAAGGLRFTHCYSQPLCTPSRVKIMTGKYNFRNYLEFGYLDPAERTFGHLMQEAGYRTCIAGKWQLNGLAYNLPGNQDSQRPLAAGFDESCLWQVTKLRKTGERYADPLVEVNGKPLPPLEGAYGPQVFADFVCDFLERNQSQPFFVYYPMVLPHDPFVPTPDTPAWEEGDRYQKDPRFFAEMVTYTDKIVGQIDSKLSELGIREDTILMFTADNGTNRAITTRLVDGSELRGGKGTTPNAGTHVPFVASWPGTVPPGFVADDLIEFSDFFATLVDLVGDPLATGERDGRSFLPRLRGEAGNPRDFTFCHYSPRWGRLDRYRGRFVRDHNYKLYLDGKLYHIPSDMLEQMAIEPGDVTADLARRRLQPILDAMPPWTTRPRIPSQTAPTASQLPPAGSNHP